MWSTEIRVTRNDTRDDIEIYRDYIKECYGQDLDSFEFELRNWETTPGNGYWLATHNHGHSQFTIIRYVEVDGSGGELLIQDPRPNANRNWPAELGGQFAPLVVQPESGMTVIFPSFCYHQAAPFTGRIRRATVSEIELYSRTEDPGKMGTSSV